MLGADTGDGHRSRLMGGMGNNFHGIWVQFLIGNCSSRSVEGGCDVVLHNNV